MDARKMYNTWKKDSKRAKQLTKLTACMIALDIQHSIADNVSFIIQNCRFAIQNIIMYNF